ncbi:NTF2-like N-terminal transpeptidase domain-containing protein [Tumebacillus permanentifrigoris]|uniref:MecA-like transpeptidase family protein n=1 Tax=Tumebacillus permanentifrigoris TaxID=378543 RepID=A0A316D927_9BACL|nr:NTF2-like N-terminal transpeptidase domain-containing protein [Tumebacillus permanentifrigoris]PWK13479.1 MecA-like transpeptidase family protein [Tumebacillus permanentifrigoris]
MFRPNKILTKLLVSGALAVGIGWGGSVYATQEDQKSATKMVEDYVSAFTKNDVAGMVKHVKDSRAKDSNELEAMYQQFVKQNTDEHAQLKLDGIVEASDGTYLANFQMKTDLYEKGWVQYSLPLIKENGEWKIYVDGNLVVDTKIKK